MGGAPRLWPGVWRIAGVRLAHPAVLGHFGLWHRAVAWGGRFPQLLDDRIGSRHRRGARRLALLLAGVSLPRPDRTRLAAEPLPQSHPARAQILQALGRLGHRARAVFGALS